MWVSGVWHDSERDWVRNEAQDGAPGGARDGAPGGVRGGARDEARTVAGAV